MVVSCIKYFLFVQSVSAICKERDCRALSPKDALVIVQNRAVRVKGKARDKRAVENNGEGAMSMDSSAKQRSGLNGTSEGVVGDAVGKYVTAAVGKAIAGLGDVVPEEHLNTIADSAGEQVGNEVDKLVEKTLENLGGLAKEVGKRLGGLDLSSDGLHQEGKTASHSVEQFAGGAADFVPIGHFQAASGNIEDGAIEFRGEGISDATMDNNFANATLAAKTIRQEGQTGQKPRISNDSNRTQARSDILSTSALPADASETVATLKDDEAMTSFGTVDLLKGDNDKTIGRTVNQLVNGGAGHVPSSNFQADDGDATMESRLANTDRTHDKLDVPSTAALSEDGYQKVAALKDDEAMLRFVHRQMDAIGLRALSQDKLNGWVGWFSGTRATQNYDAMMSELRTKDWIIPEEN